MLILTTALAGMTAGLVHVLSGPDHLAAIAPLASNQRRAPWAAGFLWGLGHSAGVLLVGLLALWLRGWLPIAALSSWSERAVGGVLIAIGLWGLHRALGRRVHSHPHAHGQLRHDHAHVHGAPAVVDEQHRRSRHSHTHAAFIVGILHGLAGSSHLVGVLPALALPGLAASLGYLGGYGAGTVLAMTVFAYGIGWLTSRARVSGDRAPRVLLSASSVLALIVGAVWLAT